MNSRERTLLALGHEAADRIPIDFWATDTVYRNLETKTGMSRGAFLDRYDVDLRYIEGPRYTGPPLEQGADIWGVSRGSVSAGSGDGSEQYSEVTKAPLAGADSPEEIHDYPHWPDPDWYDYTVIEAQCDSVLAEDRVAVFMGDRLNRIAQLKPAMYLRGTEEILMDIALREDVAKAVFDNIRGFYLAYLERILDAANGKLDIVLTGDDFGAQNGLLVSPDTWRNLIRPGFAEYIDLIKSRDTKVMHHTCGSVVDIIPDMIDCGLNVLQSVQPEAKGMALAELVPTFGDRLCFQGGVSIQKTMPHGSPDDIRDEVRAIADIVKSRGGYIFCTSHNIQADTPVGNTIALLEAYEKYGKAGPGVD